MGNDARNMSSQPSEPLVDYYAPRKRARPISHSLGGFSIIQLGNADERVRDNDVAAAAVEAAAAAAARHSFIQGVADSGSLCGSRHRRKEACLERRERGIQGQKSMGSGREGERRERRESATGSGKIRAGGQTHTAARILFMNRTTDGARALLGVNATSP